MDRVEVGRYPNPQAVGGWLGWVATPEWIVFEHESGSIAAFNGRDVRGGVVGIGTVLAREAAATGVDVGVQSPAPAPPPSNPAR